MRNNKTHYQIIFMDLQMPEMDGIDAVKIIRRDLDKDVPIIALTAAVMKKDKEESLAAGMNDFLTKPIHSDKLREMIAKWI